MIIAFLILINAICLLCCCKSAGKSERYIEQINLRKDDENDNTV